MNENLPIPGDGIIGVTFLRQVKAEISFHYNTIVTDCQPLRPIPFVTSSKNSEGVKREGRGENCPIFRIQARNRQVIPINVSNEMITEGYIPRLDAGDGLFIDNAAVSVKDGKCYALAINTTKSDICVQLEPQEIIPCDFANSDSFENDLWASESDTGQSITVIERVNKVLKKVG